MNYKTSLSIAVIFNTFLKLKSHETTAILKLSIKTSIHYIIVAEKYKGPICYS